MADEPEQDVRITVGEEARRIAHEALGATERAVSGTSGVSAWVVVLLGSLTVVAALAPYPFNLFGVGVAVLLAFNLRRSK